jgi:hypothetical protein
MEPAQSRGRVTRLMLGPAGWDSRPRRLSTAAGVTAEPDALAAMDLATVTSRTAAPAGTEPGLSVWEYEGGQLAGHAETD